MASRVTIRKDLYRYLIDNGASAPYFREMILPFYRALNLDKYTNEEILELYKLFKKHKFTKNTLNTVQSLNSSIKTPFMDVANEYRSDFKLKNLAEIEEWLALASKISHIINNCKNYNNTIVREFEIDINLSITDNYKKLLNKLENSLAYNKKRTSYMNTKQAKQEGKWQAIKTFKENNQDLLYKKEDITYPELATTVYHGSNHNFRTLRISPKLVNSESTLRNEGLGIYFSTDPEVAKSYGRYLYTLQINNKYLKDFRDLNTCSNYLFDLIKHIHSESKIDIRNFIELQFLIYRIHDGSQCITELPREIFMLLDSSDKFYTLHADKLDMIEKIAQQYVKNTLKAFMFNYNIPNIGVIKDVSTNVVRICRQDKLY